MSHSDRGSVAPPRKKKSPFFIVSVIALVVALGGLLNIWIKIGTHQGYAPDQPIPFNHKIHAGTYSIPCMYCHSGVEKGRHALVPSLNVCMNCHSVVKPESPWIQKLKQYALEKKQPVEWIKVYDLPDYVNFSHKRHLAKGVSCETCHGDVKNMEKIVVEKPISMAFCMDCHNGKTAPPDLVANAKKKPPAPGSGVLPGGIAPVSCYTCHQ